MQHIPDLYADIDLQMLKKKVQAIESAITNPKREWVGLTDEEIELIVDAHTTDSGGFDIWCDGFGVARAVMEKLKEMNNG